MRRLLPFLCFCLAACSRGHIDFADASFACSTQADCSAGFVCDEGLCVPTGIIDDAGLDDAGASDGGFIEGEADGGQPDAGDADGGPPDAGAPDAGMGDAGLADAGPPDAGPVDAGPPKFMLGDTIFAAYRVNVRASGSSMAIVNGTQLPNAIGTIVSGPVGAGATRFWQVNYANGVDGWTTESLIEKLAPDAGLPGPLAWWSFSENTGATTADSSGQGNTGTLVGAPTWVPGKVGSGLSFDGVNDYVLAPHSASLNVQNPPLSLSAWVYPRSNSTVFRSIFAKNYTYYLYANVSSMYCGTGGGTFAGFNGPDPSWVCHPTLLPLNTWTWVTANYDGTQFTLYKGIIEVASRPGIGAIYASDGGFQIGASQWGEYFDGVIDDVLVYPRQLSVAEIAAFVAGPQG